MAVRAFLQDHAQAMEASNVNMAVMLSAIEGLREKAEELQPIAEKVNAVHRALENQDLIL